MEWINRGQMDERMKEWTDGHMKEWINEWMQKRMSTWNGWLNKRANRGIRWTIDWNNIWKNIKWKRVNELTNTVVNRVMTWKSEQTV